MAKKTNQHAVRKVNRLDEALDLPIDRDERRGELLRRKGVANAVAAAKAVEPLLRKALAER